MNAPMNNPSFISDDEIDRALDYLRDNARDAAQARANRIYVEEYRKVVKAQLMKEHGAMSAVLTNKNADVAQLLAKAETDVNTVLANS